MISENVKRAIRTYKFALLRRPKKEATAEAALVQAIEAEVAAARRIGYGPYNPAMVEKILEAAAGPHIPADDFIASLKGKPHDADPTDKSTAELMMERDTWKQRAEIAETEIVRRATLMASNWKPST